MTKSSGMYTLLSSDVDALMWPSMRARSGSAWHGHVSFAHWLVKAVRPRLIVELGTHNGVSYAAFCNAISHLALPSLCYAIDTWMGDEHTGAYSESVYEDVRDFTSTRFPNIGKLSRCLFLEARDQFDDGSVDILHIDGLHTYEAVKEDFETWRAKLSDRAVVIFHDTTVRFENFGVWKLWEELSAKYPGFNFHHSYGLGVLAVGRYVSPDVQSLCRLTADEQERMRKLFELASANAQRSGLEAGLREAQAKVPPGLVNVALGCETQQSSSLIEEFSHAVPGVIKNGGYGFHTEYENQPWWMVDLRMPRDIRHVAIYNRLDEQCRGRSRGLTVSVSDNAVDWRDVHTHSGQPFGGVDGLPLHISLSETARFVRVQLPEKNYLHLDQIEIYSSSGV